MNGAPGAAAGADTTPRGAASGGGRAATLPALTGIRLPLALWVVAHHISGPGRMLQPLSEGNAAVRLMFADAWAALPIFFTISGFVLAHAYAPADWTRPQLQRYAAARFGRVYPLYFLSLLVVLPFIATALRTDPTLGGPGARVGLLSNYLLLLQAWHWPDVNWNTPAWSLSCEVFFYACAPAVVLLVRRPSWTRVAAVAAFACAVPMAARVLMAAPPKPLLYAGDFVVGVAAAGAYARLRTHGSPLADGGAWLYWPAVGGLVLLLLFQHAGGSFLLFDIGVRVAIAILVLGLACGGAGVAAILSSPLMVAGGRASYALYILHVPLLWWWRYYALDVRITPLLSAAMYLAVTVITAQAACRWYELPADRAIRRYAAALRSRSTRHGVTPSAYTYTCPSPPGTVSVFER